MLKRYAIVERVTGKKVFTTKSRWIVDKIFSAFDLERYEIASYRVSYK